MNKKFVPVPVAENLSWEEFSRINLHLPYLPGVQPDVGETRDYPFGDELVAYPGLCRAGLAGGQEATTTIRCWICRAFASASAASKRRSTTRCAARPARCRVEVNAYGRVIRELGHEPGVPGKDVWLTIDREVQQFADQRLGDESAACVVHGCADRRRPRAVLHAGLTIPICSMSASRPTNGATLTDRRPQAAAQQGDRRRSIRRARPSRPRWRWRRSRTGFARSARSTAPASLQLGNHAFHCWAWKKGGHGHVDLKRGIAVSCDVFFYEVARRLGIDKIAGSGAQAGAWRADRHRIAGRTLRASSRAAPGSMTTLRRSLAAGRYAQRRHRPGLCDRDAAAALHAGRAHRERQGGHAAPGACGRQRRRQPRPSPAPLPFSDEALAAVREGMNAVDQ